jgi:hypothetical protein
MRLTEPGVRGDTVCVCDENAPQGFDPHPETPRLRLGMPVSTVVVLLLPNDC